MTFKFNKLLLFKLGSSHVVNSRLMYHRLKAEDYARERTTLLGRRGLRHILSFMLFVSVAVAAFVMCFKWGAQGKIFLMILAIIPGVYATAYSILFLPLALNLTIKQLRLNKKAIGYINVALLILVLIAFILFILFLKFS